MTSCHDNLLQSLHVDGLLYIHPIEPFVLFHVGVDVALQKAFEPVLTAVHVHISTPDHKMRSRASSRTTSLTASDSVLHTDQLTTLTYLN